jgi:hypothetical protein
MCLRVSYKEKKGKNNFCIFKVTEDTGFWPYSLYCCRSGGGGRGVLTLSDPDLCIQDCRIRIWRRILVYRTDGSSCPPFLLLDLSWTTTAPAWPRVRWTPASGSATSRPRLVESVSPVVISAGYPKIVSYKFLCSEAFPYVKVFCWFLISWALGTSLFWVWPWKSTFFCPKWHSPNVSMPLHRAQKILDSRAQPPSTCLVMYLPASKVLRGRINNRSLNSYFVVVSVFAA